MDELITPSQVAGLLQIHPRTVCRLAEKGTIPGIRIGRNWRFHNKDILNLASSPQRKWHISDPTGAEGQIQRQRHRLEVLHEIGLATNSTLDLQSVLELLLEKIDHLLPHPAATTVRLLNKETEELELAACRHLGEEEWRVAVAQGRGGLSKTVFKNKAPLIIANVQTDSRTRDPKFFREHGLVSYLGVPLIAKDEVLGVLSFFTKEEYPFSDGEVKFLSMLANQLATSIHNSRLYEQTKRRTDELSALYAVTASASATLNLDTLLQKVIKNITEIFHFDATRIFLLDAKMDELHLRASFEVQPGFLSGRPGFFRLGQGTVGKVAQSGEAVIFENVQCDPRYQEMADKKTALKEGYNFFAIFPIKSKFRTVGTISCIGRKPRHMTPSKIQLITSIASQIGVAVENASLYQESQRREELQGLLKELSQDITSLDINSLLKKLTEK
ncbi:MAG: GAF domain-containing protein, partial [Candidatus Binatia bacterium]